MKTYVFVLSILLATQNAFAQDGDEIDVSECEAATMSVSSSDLTKEDVRYVLRSLGLRHKVSRTFLFTKAKLLIPPLFNGKPFTGSMVYSAALREYGGDFAKAQIDAGLDPYEHGFKLEPLSREDVLRGVQYLKRHGFSVTYGDLWKSKKDSPLAKALSFLLKRPIVGRGLVMAALKFFPDWGEAVVAAGFKKEDAYVLDDRLTTDEVVRAIQALVADDRPVTAGKIRLDDSTESAQFLFEKTGKRVTPAKVYTDGRNAFDGSWVKALEAAQVPANRWYATKAYHKWTKEEIVRILKTAYLQDLDVNFNAFSLHATNEHMEIIWQVTGDRDLTAKAFITAVQAKFRSDGENKAWDKALRAAGIDPNNARLRFSWTPELVLASFRELVRQGVDLEHPLILKDENGEVARVLTEFHGFPMNSNKLIKAFYRYFSDWNAVTRQVVLSLDDSDQL